MINFHDEYEKEFKNASFLEKANRTELLYYEHIDNIKSPDFIMKAANLLNLMELPKEDLLIIEQDWNIIVNKIKEGKAEELSDRLTKYLTTTTKGGKTESNLRGQPFSNIKAHKRAFTLKTSYIL